MKNICVFCGSSSGYDPVYKKAARRLGDVIATENMRLVYGAGSVGLMGVIADQVLAEGGEVYGVIPAFLVEKEVDHKGLTESYVVASMHERKKKMSDLSDAFIAIPGGFGTLEELFEIVTWVQLGLFQKPVGLLNVAGFFDSLVDQLETMVEAGFLKQENMDMLCVEEDPVRLIRRLQRSKGAAVPKWIPQGRE